MGKLITQKKIAETLGIPACYVSQAMRREKPVKREGHDTLYDAKTAFNAMQSHYEGLATDAKLKYEEKERRYSGVADAAKREIAKLG